MVVSKEEILRSLKSIIDPDFNQDIVSLGFIKNLTIEGGNISFDIQLTTEFCPVKSEFKRLAEQAVLSIAGVDKVEVNLTSMEQTKRTLKVADSGLVNVKNIIAISSCKGGVGKSTVAAAIAKNLASRNLQIGLLDADIFGPSIPTLLNIQNVEVLGTAEGRLLPIIEGNMKIMSFGFLSPGKPAVMRGPMVSNYLQQLLHRVEWGELDYLIIDMPPGTGDIQLTLSQTVQLDGSIIVTTRQSLALEDVAKGILMFEQVKVPMLGIIENMSYFICDHCSTKHYIFGSNELNLEEKFGLKTLAQLPLTSDLSQSFETMCETPYIHEMTDKVIMALGKSKLGGDSTPTIEFNENTITLIWPNGKKDEIRNFDLRLNCKCAMCVNEHSGQQIIRKENIKPDIAPVEIYKLGNYALSVKWNDGHSTGIYPYDLISNLVSV